jgi:transporter family-2 protein
VPSFVYVVLALIGGAGLATQAAVNARLSLATGHPVTAATISFGIGFAFLLIGLFAFRVPVPAASALASMPIWGWVGGALGATYVALAILVVPKIGTAAAVALVVAGQMAASLALDHVGAFGLAEHGINIWRIVGALLLTAGVVLIRAY